MMQTFLRFLKVMGEASETHKVTDNTFVKVMRFGVILLRAI